MPSNEDRVISLNGRVALRGDTVFVENDVATRFAWIYEQTPAYAYVVECHGPDATFNTVSTDVEKILASITVEN